MISKIEHLKDRAIDILTERAERSVIGLGEIMPDHTMKTFDGTELSINSLVEEKPLLIAFLRASW